MPLVTATFSTGGNVIINDEVEVALLVALEKLLIEHSVASVNIPGTPAANMAVIAGSVNDIAALMTTMIAEQKKINNNLGTLVASLSSINANVGTAVTTSQLSYIEQTKQNAFLKQTQNDALKRADLPPTTVTSGAVLEQIQTTASDMANFNVQSSVAGLTQKGLTFVGGLATDGLTFVYGKATTYVAESAIGQKVTQLWNKIFPPAKQTIVETNSAGRATFVGQLATKPTPPDIGQYI